jgi:hypothetical protein
LLFTLTPWPGLDVQYQLGHRALDDDLSWRLILATSMSLGIAGWTLLHRHIAFSRGASIVTNGPYAIVRHPIYLCLIIAMFATAMLFGRPSSFVALLFTLVFVTKAVIEEQRTQGPAFAAYKRRALMFVPVLGFVWFFLTWILHRLRHAMARDAPVMPAPTPPTIQPEPKHSAEDLPPQSRVHSVALEFILDDDEGVGAGQR